jgi:hypothetical protein
VPAAFLSIVRNCNLVDGDCTTDAGYWTDVNETTTNALNGSYTNRNQSYFENASFVQLNNVVYIANGYDELQKYDGQTIYRAGLPKPSSITSALGGAGAITGNNYYHVAVYEQIDAVGNINYGNELMVSTGLNAVAQSMDVTVANIQAGSGFNTNCAIVNGAQVAVTTITVDDGSGGSHTMKVGDTAYFYDSISASYVERNITAINATSITIAGAAVTVADNAVISNNLRIMLFRNETAALTPEVFYLVAEIPNNSFAATQSYNDNITDANLGEEFIPPINARDLPPKGKYVSSY